MAAAEPAARPIGVFDSGVGGMTVLRALAAELPLEDFLYLGDTARLPYGTKSAGTVVRYALQAADRLIARGVKALVIACNTASAAALPAMRERCGDLPVIGVIEPGALAACAASRNGRIAVIATEATVRGGAYQQAIARRRADAQVSAAPCQLFVALAEEGWTQGPVARAAAERYLRPLFGSGGAGVSCGHDTFSPAAMPGAAPAGQAALNDTLVLGCTHFPPLLDVIRATVGPDVAIVDSAHTTSAAVHAQLGALGLLRTAGEGELRFLATDGVARFAAVGGRFLGRDIAADSVELIDL